MAYNTKEVLKDVDGNPISQYYDPVTDSYEPVEGSNGGNKVTVENNDLSLIPILDKLSQLTGTVIDEESRKSNEIQRIADEDIRKSNEVDRIDNESTRVNSENTRKTQESDRVSAESSRVNVESGRVTAENTRVSNEDTRKSNETSRESSEATRDSNEDTRKSNESTRQSNESSRISAENIREDNEDERIANESSREQKESTREDNESTRQSNENIRTNNELAREDSELVRQANMEIVQGWINNPEQFDGRDLEFTWRGTELGVRPEGDTEYTYVDLKGETGIIENLTEQHVINALGFTPLSEDSLPSNLETTTGSQAKANQAEQNAKDYTDSELANFEGMVEHGNEYHSVPYAKESDLTTHLAEKVHQGEIHGLRTNYKTGLEYFDGENWEWAGRKAFDLSNWKDVQNIVRQGFASEFFSVGDQIASSYDGKEIIWEVIGIDVETPTDSNFTHSMTLQTKDCLEERVWNSGSDNRYINSSIRAYLNSSAFLNRIDPELIAVIGEVNKKVAVRNDIGGQDSFSDKVFLLSEREVDSGGEGVTTGEFVYPFYSGKGNANRIKNLDGGVRNWWLRSPSVLDLNGVRRVTTSGAFSTRGSSEVYGVSPACVII